MFNKMFGYFSIYFVNIAQNLFSITPQIICMKDEFDGFSRIYFSNIVGFNIFLRIALIYLKKYCDLYFEVL